MSELVHDRARRDAPRELLVTRDRSTLPRYESGKFSTCRGLLNWLLITGRGQLERVLRVRVDVDAEPQDMLDGLFSGDV
jgi:hypothetical protein